MAHLGPRTKRAWIAGLESPRARYGMSLRRASARSPARRWVSLRCVERIACEGSFEAELPGALVLLCVGHVRRSRHRGDEGTIQELDRRRERPQDVDQEHHPFV